MLVWLVLAFLAGGFFGFLLAGLLAAAKRGDEAMERQAAEARPAGGAVVNGPQDLERLGIPVLGVIPDLGGSGEVGAAREPEI